MASEQDGDRPAENVQSVPKSEIAVFWMSDDFARTVETAARDRRMARANIYIEPGGIAGATAAYRGTPSPNLVIVESDADNEKLMAELATLAVECVAGTKVIVVGQRNDVDLYRNLLKAGVSDYLVAPLTPLAFMTAVANSLRSTKEEGLGRIIACIGAKGGAGSSTVAHNIAAAITQQSDADVLLADLDLQFGVLDLNFDVEPAHGMKDVLESTERVDDVLLERISIERPGGLHLLPSAVAFDSFKGLREGDVEKLLDVARDSSWYMVLDVPHYWGPWTKKVLASADEIVITAAPDLASMRNAKNMIETLVKARPTDPSPRLVINKVRTPGVQEITPEDFAKAVKSEDWTSIGYEPRLFSKASNEGRMLVETERGSKPARALSEVAYKVTGRRERRKKVKPGLRNLFGLTNGGGRRWGDKVRSTRVRAKAFKESESGVSAIEFALLAPMMALGLVAMSDVGLALHERMSIDHILRAGAQAAMTDPGRAAVDRVMQASLAGVPALAGATLKPAVRYCACPENASAPPDPTVSCQTLVCDLSASPYVYYRLEASKPYSPMSVPEALPDFTLSSSMQVQVR